MTWRRLRRHVLLAVVFLVAYATIGVVLNCRSSSAYGVFKDLIPVALGVPLALLTFSFQRRMSYLQALRDFWQRLIPAVQSAIQFTHLSNPGQADFARTLEALATVMDLARGVFANVPIAKNRNGLYPYENLKDIYNTISWLGVTNGRSEVDRANARRCVTRLWQEMYNALLVEFDRDVPMNPVSKYLHRGCSIADKLIAGEFKPDDAADYTFASRGGPS